MPRLRALDRCSLCIPGRYVDEVVARPAHHLFGCVAKHVRQFRVDKLYHGLPVNDPDAFLRQLHDLPVLALALPQRHLSPAALDDLGTQRLVDVQQLVPARLHLDLQAVLRLAELFFLPDMPRDVPHRDEKRWPALPFHLDHAHLHGDELAELPENVHLHRLLQDDREPEQLADQLLLGYIE